MKQQIIDYNKKKITIKKMFLKYVLNIKLLVLYK